MRDYTEVWKLREKNWLRKLIICCIICELLETDQEKFNLILSSCKLSFPFQTSLVSCFLSRNAAQHAVLVLVTAEIFFERQFLQRFAICFMDVYL